MITFVKEKRVMTERDVDFEFDGHWVLLDEREFPSEFMGYVVAYGDDSAEDRDALMQICLDEYNGKAMLLHGYKPQEEVMNCYGVYNS